MKVNVVNPKVWNLTSKQEAQCQLARCAFAAGLSRGRLDSIHVPYVSSSSGGYVEGVPWDVTPEVGRTFEGVKLVESKSFEEAEALLGRLLAIKPYPHETVIEHSAVSFLFRMSRIASHEIVRHRLSAITQQSTRYCESGKDESVTFIRPLDRPEEDCGEYASTCGTTLKGDGKYAPNWVIYAIRALDNYRDELEAGRKREYARYLLPHCIEVWLQMTANFREWRHIIRLRTSKAAAPEMRLLLGQVRDELEKVSPVLVEGL